MVAMAQERGLGKGKCMLRGSLVRVVVKAVSHFRFIREWLMHGTDPPGNFCAFMIVRNSFISRAKASGVIVGAQAMACTQVAGSMPESW
ncbi:hypothetical protein DPMN_013476 [Dreissena polymorpha]|uniref:Uncharacterized protein n=1 Tax=Dreissena polymorpha TaxID=45954 RepID=A0A9D4N9Y0_DREPO|nr:hypothetical protein DPMN_013476 [Dreissena polymorpha]